jgi:hypothetical protein
VETGRGSQALWLYAVRIGFSGRELTGLSSTLGVAFSVQYGLILRNNGWKPPSDSILNQMDRGHCLEKGFSIESPVRGFLFGGPVAGGNREPGAESEQWALSPFFVRGP